MTDSIYNKLGGEAPIRKLVDRFYDLMDECAEAATIRALHPEDLKESRDKLYEFLVGWCGGPPLYVSKYGHPRLRARHLPFPISEAERDQWVHCMRLALEDCIPQEDVRTFLDERFYQIADFMQNKEDH